MPWTESMDKELRDLSKTGLSRAQIARQMGVSKHSVMNRARRIGVKFYTSFRRLDTSGHKPFTSRCAEIFRQHGVML